MTDAEEKRVVKSNSHRTVWHDDADERYGTDEDFQRYYDSSAAEVVIEHVSSGDTLKLGQNYRHYPVLEAAPSDPSAGDVAMQDGDNWNPTSSGAQELVTYNGTSWVSA